LAESRKAFDQANQKTWHAFKAPAPPKSGSEVLAQVKK
jgi:hypothetical protein